MIGTESAPAQARSRRGGRLLAVSIALVILLAAGWYATSSHAVPATTSQPGTGGDVAEGETFYFGMLGLAERDIVVTDLEPIVTGGLSANVLLCRPDPSFGASIGSVKDDDVNQACRELVPVTGDVPVAAGPGRDYLVVAVTRLDEGVQRLCGVKVRYRDGWRRGSDTAQPTAVLGPGEDVLGDAERWPPCP